MESERLMALGGLVVLALLYLALSAARRALQGCTLLSLSRRMEADRASHLLDPGSPERVALGLARLVALLGAAVLAVPVTSAAVPDRGTVLAFLLLFAGLVVVGEGLVARPLAARFPESVLTLTGPLLRAATVLLVPLSHPLAALGRSGPHVDGESGEKDEEEMEEELQAYIDVGEAQGILEGDEGELVQQIVSFGDTIVREVMTPRTEMVAVSVEAGVEEARRLFVDSRHSRLPVFRASLDEIVGILTVRDLLGASPDAEAPPSLESIMRPVHLVPETRPVADLLRDLQRKRMPLAVVVDEYGGTAGLVTIEDLLEEIVGEIKDEHEVEEEIVVLGEGAWLVNGLCSVEDLEEAVGEELEHGEYDSVGGLIFSRLGRLPEVGETVRVGALEMEVLQLDGRRVARVRVSRMAETAGGEEGR